MATCPNKSLQEWKDLVIARGSYMAHYLWDTYDGQVPESESRSEIVKSGLKAIDILYSSKADQFFNAVAKNKITGDFFWRKMQADLGIPKDQIDILKTFNTQDRGELVSSLLGNYSYTVEVNLSTDSKSNQNYGDSMEKGFRRGQFKYWINYKYEYIKRGFEENDPQIKITKEEYEQAFTKQEKKPTAHYSNLTVPGGTNYTENEISTPAITPSIKGHAQFATDNGIGWFRSDEESKKFIEGTKKSRKITDEKLIRELEQEDRKITLIGDIEYFKNINGEWFTIDREYTQPKTRRILEVQSDLFQKGRDKEELTKIPVSNFLEKLTKEEQELYKKLQRKNYSDFTEEEIKFYDKVDKLVNQNTSNSFLQLLNKNNNWVTFFIKSIIQDSSKKGYEKVLFPSGDTASKVEGHNTLAEFKKQKEDRIKELKENNELTKPVTNTAQVPRMSFNFITQENRKVQVDYKKRDNDKYGFIGTYLDTKETREINASNVLIDAYNRYVSQQKEKNNNEITQLKQELERVETEGIFALKPIYSFYENTVKNILSKQYGKENVKQITDEYGNTWNEVEILPERDQSVIFFQKESEEEEQVPASTASTETLAKVKELIVKMGVNIQTLQDYLKGNPDVKAKGVTALADLVNKIIAVAEGKEGVALTEEMIHVATAMIEQVNPELIREMISKIDRFAIYNRVLNAYKTDPNYQLPNGKPDIRKIKKEAVDKLLAELIIKQSEGSTEFPELLNETARSLIRVWFDKIMDWFRGQYKKSNINIFEEVASKIAEGDFITQDLSDGGVYFQKSKAQELIQGRIINTAENLDKRDKENKTPTPMFMDTEEDDNYYVQRQADGSWKKIEKRVTDRVKRWYNEKFGNKKFSKEQEEFNELKRDLGIRFHSYMEEIHNRYFDSKTGERKTKVTPRTSVFTSEDEEVYEKLEKYFVGLIAKFSKEGKSPLVFSEAIIFDPKEKEAGTIDLLIVEESGKAHIFDWKFMSVGANQDDVPWYKQGAFNIQLGRYKDILRTSYGIKEFGEMKAVPILFEFKRKNRKNPDSELVLGGIEVGSLDISKITDFRLMPVSEITESTGYEELDDVIKQLNNVMEQVGKKEVTNEEERQYKKERLNIIRKAMRAAQASRNLTPLIEVIKIMKKEGQQLINDWNTVYDKLEAKSDDVDNSTLSDFADDLNDYIALSGVFGKMHDIIGDIIYTEDMEKNAKTKAEKALVKAKKQASEEIRIQSDNIRKSHEQVKKIAGKFADKFVGERNLISGLLKNEAVWKSVASWFRGSSEAPLASVKILNKLVGDAKINATRDASVHIERLLKIREKLIARGGNLRKLAQEIYQKDDKGGLVNKLIYKYKKDFFDAVDKNALEGNQDKNWLLQNINVEEYKKEANEVLNRRIDKIKKDYKNDVELKIKLIKEERRRFDISDANFNGWDNYIIKRHPLTKTNAKGEVESKWFSEEYNKVKQDPELLELYNFITEMNATASDIGYIQNQVQSTFLPFIRKSMAENLAWNFSLSSIMDFGDSLSHRASDVGMGSVNSLTGEIEHAIPKYYTHDFSHQGEGIHDYSDVSEDIFKNMILYVSHVNKYKYLSEVEGQLNLIKTVETFKQHIATTLTGELITDSNDAAVIEAGNEKNVEMFDQFMRALLYEQKYPLSNTDLNMTIGVTHYMKKAINAVSQSLGGEKVFNVADKPTATSLAKTMDTLNRGFQLKTLGFDIISGTVNAFGMNVQIAAQAGHYFKKTEYAKNYAKLIGNRFTNDDERKMFVQLIELFMPLKEDPNYEKMKKAGMSALTQHNFSEWLMVFMREPEIHSEKAIFLTLLENTMVEDGKLVNIREFVNKKYAGKYDSASSFKEASQKIDAEIAELQKTRSISATKKLEDGKLVIPGLDLKDFKQINALTKLNRRIVSNATGALSDSEVNKASLSILGKSALIFKGWIPKLVDTRFGELRKAADDFSLTINEEGMTEGQKYELGRVRVFWEFATWKLLKMGKDITDVLYVTEGGIERMNEYYDKMAEAYRKRTGEELEMTREEFMDFIRTNLKNQIQEFTALVALVGLAMSLGFFQPDDDKDKATKNAFRFAQRVMDKFVGELSFFYNPLEVERMLQGSAFPAIGLIGDIIRFFKHFTLELTGLDITDPDLSSEEVRKHAQPIKYAAKVFPLTKSLINYGAMIDSDFAKDFDITIPKESNR